MAVTVVPMATLIIITSPFTSADARWWYLARPWLQGAVQAARLVGGVDYTVVGEGWLPDSEDNQRIILCPKHQSTWETFLTGPVGGGGGAWQFCEKTFCY